MTIIRPARIRDAEQLARVFNPYVGIATMVLQARSAADYLPLLESKRCAVLVAEAGDRVVGYASVKPYSLRAGYARSAEVSVFLAEAATGLSIGQQLYDALFPQATALGYQHFTARIWGENAGSVRFHARNGFRMVGRQEKIGFVHERWVDVVLMERFIPTAPTPPPPPGV
ncbi:MAG: N-acetyltransferase family protein [Bacteroidota bacterium]